MAKAEALAKMTALRAFEKDDGAMLDRALDLLREQGLDPDKVLRQVVASMHAWTCVPPRLRDRLWSRSFHEFAYEDDNMDIDPAAPPTPYEPMTALSGEDVPDPLADATYINDLVWYDGPFVAEFRTAAGASLIAWWCDQDQAAHRWIIAELTDAQMTALKDSKYPGREALRNAVGGVVWIQDRAGETVFATRMAACADIPPNCLPEEGATLPEVCP
jgi:hypothetical protein